MSRRDCWDFRIDRRRDVIVDVIVARGLVRYKDSISERIVEMFDSERLEH